MQSGSPQPGIYVTSAVYDAMRDTRSFTSAGGITVDGDAVTVRDVVPEKRTGEFFLRHIAKQNVLMEDLVPAKPLVYKGKLGAAQTATA